MIILQDKILYENIDDLGDGKIYGVLFKDNDKFGWFTEFRANIDTKPGEGTIGKTSKLYKTQYWAIRSWKSQFGPF